MLSCRELTEHHASDYVDGRLPWRRRLSVGFHLAICGACRRFMAQLRLVKTVLRNKPETPMPEAEAAPLADKLHQAFQEQQKKSSD
jgi:anti-sigma factor RsiW